MPLPKTFVWTRFGTEAGQSIEEIVSRKEEERIRNEGLFLWGIGNNVTPSLAALLKSTEEPKVVFSPIKSKPRQHDVAPGTIAVWRKATGPDGKPFEIPKHSIITSRGTSRKNKHYALVCKSNKSLEINQNLAQVYMNQLANINSGARLGFSQVTAIVEMADMAPEIESRYIVSMCCKLVPPFIVTLHSPIFTVLPFEKSGADIADIAQSDETSVLNAHQFSLPFN